MKPGRRDIRHKVVITGDELRGLRRHTGSMAEDGKMPAMKTAAKNLIDQLSGLARNAVRGGPAEPRAEGRVPVRRVLRDGEGVAGVEPGHQDLGLIVDRHDGDRYVGQVGLAVFRVRERVVHAGRAVVVRRRVVRESAEVADEQEGPVRFIAFAPALRVPDAEVVREDARRRQAAAPGRAARGPGCAFLLPCPASWPPRPHSSWSRGPNPRRPRR